MRFATIISKAFKQAAKEDEKKFREQTQFFSTSSSSSSHQNHHNAPNIKVHLIPSEWIESFQAYLEKKVELDKPPPIQNESLLDFYNPDSKEFVIFTSSKATNAHNVESASSDGDASLSDSSTCVMVGSSPSSNSTQNSFVLTNENNQNPSDAQSYANVAAGGRGLNSDLKPDGKEVDERTKRRMKWASKKEKSSKSKVEGETAHQQQSSLNNGVEDEKKANILKENIQHKRDYYVLGDSAWMILSSKFGFDVDIELPLYFDSSVDRLIVGGILLQIPENGSFNYLEEIYEICDGDNPNIVRNGPSDSSDEEFLYGDNDNQTETPSSQIFLLPSSTTSYTANANDATSTSSPSTSENMNIPLSNPKKRKRYGLGLGNLGNTCFMNSTLQCLAHTGPLRSYFLSGEFAKDLNKDNPLGTGGELALEFAKLLAEMWGTKESDDSDNENKGGRGYRKTWSSLSSVVYPRDFKHTLGKHAEQFMGYNQHDSQELATYLLDALHEDTNRVSKKPYIEKPEQGEDEPDDVAAKKAWGLHLKREDSRVLENFMGQVKSRVECPVEGCGRVSTTFDPFMYLSVPLPGATERTIEVEYYPMDPNERVKKFKVTLSKNTNCSEVRNKVTEKVNELAFNSAGECIIADNIVLAERFQHEIYAYYDLDDEIDKIRETDHVVAYEVSSIESIHDEIKNYEENNPPSSSDNDFQHDEQMNDRPNGRLPLDIRTKTRLNQSQEWETYLMTYTTQQTLIPSLLNPKRKDTENKMNFYVKLSSFINSCYRSSECTDALQGRSTPTSDLELDSCDGEDSEDGKMSPTSTVANKLGATAVDDETSPSLEEISQMSRTFKNVSTVEDVAILEFCGKKFRQHLKNEKEKKKSDYVDGSEIEILFRKNSRLGTQKTTFSSPLILRISPTTTVFGLREILAKRLSRVFCNNDQNASPEVFKEEKVEHQTEDMDEDMDCILDPDDTQFSTFSGAMKAMRQIPMTYERSSSNYSTYRYSNKGSSYRKLGSIATSDENVNTSQKALFVMPDNEDEKEFVLEHVGHKGKVNLCFETPALEQMFDDVELGNVETISDPNEENESQVISVLDCISNYCKMEQLEESEMWYCSRCKDHVPAWKQFHLYRAPPILIIHLKRFHYSALTHRRDKIDSFIDFPLEGLDLTHEVMFSEAGQEPIYDCYAVSNHFGGLGGGHYTAYALNDDGEWSNFDDSRVTKNVNKSEVVSKAAYVLYYRRRNIDDESWSNRAMPFPTPGSREPSPVTADMDIENENDAFSSGIVL